MAKRSGKYLDRGKEWAFRRALDAHYAAYAAYWQENIFGVGFIYKTDEA